MSLYLFEEDNSLAFNDAEILHDTGEIDPLASGASTTSTDVSNESLHKKRSFIWKYCEDMRPHGWRLLLKEIMENPVEHGIVNPHVAKK
ncbi:3650_t:CDS:2, partial [Entrophospora sp. SA101]